MTVYYKRLLKKREGLFQCDAFMKALKSCYTIWPIPLAIEKRIGMLYVDRMLQNGCLDKCVLSTITISKNHLIQSL